MAEEFGGKQPLAFLGVAALAGLAGSRFLTASAKRTSAASAAKNPGAGGAGATQQSDFPANPGGFSND